MQYIIMDHVIRMLDRKCDFIKIGWLKLSNSYYVYDKRYE